MNRRSKTIMPPSKEDVQFNKEMTAYIGRFFRSTCDVFWQRIGFEDTDTLYLIMECVPPNLGLDYINVKDNEGEKTGWQPNKNRFIPTPSTIIKVLSRGEIGYLHVRKGFLEFV